MSETNIVVTGGRVRAGYRIGELLSEKAGPGSFRGVLQIIGERSGTMHHSHWVYRTVARVSTWAEKKIDHPSTRLVSDIADTALDPKDAARETITILNGRQEGPSQPAPRAIVRRPLAPGQASRTFDPPPSPEGHEGEHAIATGAGSC